MLEYDTSMRRQLAAERAERLAGDYGRGRPGGASRRRAAGDGLWIRAGTALARLRGCPPREGAPALRG